MATWVLVDDSEAKIIYSEGWMALNSTSMNDTDADVHLSEDGTVHVFLQNTTTASFMYEFIGSQVALFGTAIIFNITKELGNGLGIPIPEPVWQCKVDEDIISNKKPYGAYPLQSYCEIDGLSETAHTIELNVTMNAGSGFWFDYLRYQVPADQLNTVPPNATAWFDSTDPRLDFIQGWQQIGLGNGVMSTTSEPAAFMDPQFLMKFNGSSVAWRALSKAGIELANASLPALSIGNSSTIVSGQWVIDGGYPNATFIVDLANETVHDNGNPYSTVLFDTSSFPVEPGPHTLTVYYDGNSTVWPLTLDFLTVSNAFPNVTVDTSSGSSISPSDVAGATSKDSKSGTIGGVVGGVLGGLLFLGLALLLYRRWQVAQRQRKRQTMVNNLEHNNVQLQRFE